MSAWIAKRFWKESTVEACGGGFAVKLDGRGVKTPAKTPLVVPTEALARMIAAEWDAQDGAVRPETMPATRMANSALDKVAPQFDAVAAMLAEYGGTDLLCYRAPDPEALIARQAAAWDPLLDWAAETFGARLATGQGVMHVAQDADAVARLARPLTDASAFQLAALHDLIAISGSLVLALAVARGRLGAAEAFDLSRIDESWQAEQWGRDEEADALEAVRRTDLAFAAQFLSACR
jgi:chaperone required for assembly of F1-ATPase